MHRQEHVEPQVANHDSVADEILSSPTTTTTAAEELGHHANVSRAHTETTAQEEKEAAMDLGEAGKRQHREGQDGDGAGAIPPTMTFPPTPRQDVPKTTPTMPESRSDTLASSSSASSSSHVHHHDNEKKAKKSKKSKKNGKDEQNGKQDEQPNKEGKELEIDDEDRPDSPQALWRCLLNVNKPAPLPHGSMDDAPIIPLHHATFLSKITYQWVTPIIRLGYQRFLMKEDLWRLPTEMESAVLADQLVEHWENRLKHVNEWNAALEDGSYHPSTRQRLWWKTRSRLKLGSSDGKKDLPGLEWALSDTFYWKWWTAGLVKVCGDTLTTTSSLVTKRIIQFGTARYLASRGAPGYISPPIGHGVGWAFLLFFMQIGASLCLHWFFTQSMSVGILGRGALIAALYRRALSLSGKSRAAIPNGKLVNHISTDISRIDFAAGFFHMAWTAPIQLIVVVIILIVQLGAVSLAGVGFLLVATPAQGVAMKKMFTLRKKAMMWTDKRAKLIQELLGGMRIIKFFAWEIPYLKKINELRRKELMKIRMLLIIRALTMAVAMSLPTIATIIAFTAFAYTGGNARNPATIFTSLTLFNLLRMPLMLMPVALATATDAKNAFNRIREVFLAEQIEKTYEIDRDAKFALQVNDGAFLWESTPPKDESDEKSRKKLAKEAKEAKKAAAAAEKSGTATPVPNSSSRGSSTPVTGPGQQSLIRTALENDMIQSRTSMSSKRQGDIASQDQAANGAGEREAISGNVTDANVPVDTADSKETTSARPSIDGGAPLVQNTPQIEGMNLSIPYGQLCAIVGPVGSGKSSLLSALIGEMKRVTGTVKFGGTVGYCPQQAWIQNATVRNNILFGQPYDEQRYNKAVYDACLQADLDMLPHGDQTEIGEKGINLSGGQKQRVNVARALYYNADITLFDDPLSAVDPHVGKWLFEHALKDALAGKTRVLVTHALHFLPYVDNIITIDHGKIVEQGTYNELIARNGAFSRLVEEFGNKEEEKKEEHEEKEADAIEDSGKEKQKEESPDKPKPTALMQEEERATGAVGSKVYKAYLKAAHPIMFPIVLLALALMQGATVVNAYVLVWWQENLWNRGQGFYLGLYAATGVAAAFFTFLMGAAAALMGFNVSINLHYGAIHRVMHAPMSMFDTTPLGRIMNRFSKDMDTIDNTLNDSMRMALSTMAQIIGSIVLIAIVQQYFLIAVAVILVLYADFARVYRYSAREIKRLDNILRSSLYAHFSESLSGLATIRAYGETEKFIQMNAKFADIENRAYFLTIYNQRWLGVRLDFLGTILTFVVAIIAVAESTRLNPSQIGLVLSYILAVQMSFTWAIRQIAEVENDMNSVERLLHYSNELEQEAAFDIDENKPPSNWPEKGEMQFKNVQLRYRPGLPLVLKGLTMHVAGGEKIGVVGRTGAGKSSLMQAIFRIVELAEGSITIDGHDISKIGLNDLRSRVSIIPQDALLFSGTLRTNLDPFGQSDDATLWDALRRVYLVDRTNGGGGTSSEHVSRFNLDMAIEDEGLNLSVGERSLVSLARALVKDSRVVILDEATASVDVATDALIQKTIRTEFQGKTLLTIAHRLRTIISYDRVLVMDKGEIAEFATPLELYQIPNGIFRGMCDQSSITAEDIEKSRFEVFQEITANEARELEQEAQQQHEEVPPRNDTL